MAKMAIFLHSIQTKTSVASHRYLSAELQLVVKDRACLHDVLKRHVSKDVDGHKRVTYVILHNVAFGRVGRRRI